MTKIADDVNSIAARLKEIQEEKLQAIMGQPLEDPKPVDPPKDIDWMGMYGVSAYRPVWGKSITGETVDLNTYWPSYSYTAGGKSK